MTKNYIVGKDYLVNDLSKPGVKSGNSKPKKMKLLNIFANFLLFENRVSGGKYTYTVSVADLKTKRAIVS